MEPYLIIIKNVVLSTLHGWVGASLSVFMFFRPLKPWRIGRVKIWQGVMPAQQVQIAEVISDVVAKELITPQALQEYLVQGQALEHQVRSAVIKWCSLPSTISVAPSIALTTLLLNVTIMLKIYALM